ncbi:SDR family NAD(P)-dependent oxidoreductase [Mesorhizobium sp.]|uniref:SDR family NAD(P)-dependent oxidoreductase n=1 Tax=Mesorhizobium sp. TaxID=1871066 RepID=UPI0025D092EE|nr:SDR family NAD(P)-dependent oxidoreductase [Mesorhizobium sp.]
MTDIEKTIAVITGAAARIRQAISGQFVANGYRVIAGDADQAGLDRLEAELNGTEKTVWSRAGDLRNKAYCAELIDYSIRAAGRLEILVNNASINTPANILETSEQHWERAFDINLASIFYMCRKAIAHVEGYGGGGIVNVSSCWDLYPGPGPAAYCTSKAVVNTPMIRTGFYDANSCQTQPSRSSTRPYHLVVSQSRRTSPTLCSSVLRGPLHRWHSGRSERRETGLLRTSHG